MVFSGIFPPIRHVFICKLSIISTRDIFSLFKCMGELREKPSTDAGKGSTVYSTDSRVSDRV